MYKKLKKQNGEKFAQTLRNYHNGIMEIPDLDQIVRHAGRDAEPLLPYLMNLLLASHDDVPVSAPANPFALLDQAGYNAFHADTLEKQNSIQHYFAPGELLCTFNDRARYKNHHIVHAIKKDVDQIERHKFKGNEQRDDEYGTSVISIQMLKTGKFISIKNRYNHTVLASDNTFNSNPDNIIEGLSTALKDYFNVDFSVSELPDEFVLMNDAIFRYHTERDNFYYGDQAWAQNGMIHTVDSGAGDALFDGFLFDNKSKTLREIDSDSRDSFPDDFNRCYGGNKALRVINGNLTLNGEILIGAEASRIKTVSLPDLTTAGDRFLRNADALTQFQAPALTTVGDSFLGKAYALTQIQVPALTTAGDDFLYLADALTQCQAPALTTVGDDFLHYADALTQIQVPALTAAGDGFLRNAPTQTRENCRLILEQNKNRKNIPRLNIQ